MYELRSTEDCTGVLYLYLYLVPLQARSTYIDVSIYEYIMKTSHRFVSFLCVYFTFLCSLIKK